MLNAFFKNGGFERNRDKLADSPSSLKIFECLALIKASIFFLGLNFAINIENSENQLTKMLA